MTTELFGTPDCAQTRELREWLDLRRIPFTEYDVAEDTVARARLAALTGGQRMVPVLVEHGVVTQIGWQGRGCVVED